MPDKRIQEWSQSKLGWKETRDRNEWANRSEKTKRMQNETFEVTSKSKLKPKHEKRAELRDRKWVLESETRLDGKKNKPKWTEVWIRNQRTKIKVSERTEFGKGEEEEDDNWLTDRIEMMMVWWSVAGAKWVGTFYNHYAQTTQRRTTHDGCEEWLTISGQLTGQEQNSLATNFKHFNVWKWRQKPFRLVNNRID